MFTSQTSGFLVHHLLFYYCRWSGGSLTGVFNPSFSINILRLPNSNVAMWFYCLLLQKPITDKMWSLYIVITSSKTNTDCHCLRKTRSCRIF